MPFITLETTLPNNLEKNPFFKHYPPGTFFFEDVPDNGAEVYLKISPMKIINLRTFEPVATYDSGWKVLTNVSLHITGEVK